MKEYFQNDITIGVEIEAHTELLKETFGDGLSNIDYDTRLVYNQRNPEFLQLTIYYKPSDYLFEKFELLRENGICILSIIKPKYVKQKWEFPDILDFSKSRLLDIQESHHWEHNKKPVILTIDNVDILINSRYAGDARFQLTKNIFQHLDEYIQYSGLGRHRHDDRFIYSDNNRESNFGTIKFILCFEHFFEPSDTRQKLSIIRDSYLVLTDETNQLTDKQLIEQGNSLCLLMSLYWAKDIDYFIARVRVNNIDNYHTRERLKYSDHAIDESEDFLLKERYHTFYDFIEVIDYEKFYSNSSLFYELVPRILKTKKVDDISAFMILYNIIEKIRNHCLSKPINGVNFIIKEEFSFTKGKDKTNKFIKNKIKEIKEIVKETDIDEFERKASDKVSFIKKTGLKDQFDSLLTYLELDPILYEIDFTNLIKIRNNIYHGKLPQEDVEPYNKQMTKLVYDMIFKMIMN